METPVVFEGEAVTRVIEIWPAEKSPFVVVQRDLCLWPRQPTEHSTIRRRDSIGDSAAGSAKPTTRRRLATPKYLARLTQRSFKSRRLTSRARSAMSVSTTASVTFSRMLRSLNVRRTVVARWPRTVTTSFGPSAARRTSIPDLAETPIPFGIVTSIGSHGLTSRPCSQAAVRPERTAPGGRRRRAASSLSSAVSGRPAHAYTFGPIRRQLAPSRCHRPSPARSASSSVNGPVVSSAGTSALRPIGARMGSDQK
jgi:hypothetical protein